MVDRGCEKEIGSFGLRAVVARLLHHATVSAMILLVATGPVLAQSAPLAADSSEAATAPRIGAAANGVPTIDITAPNAAGLSNNHYLAFNVGSGGAILNNSTASLAQSKLGGLVRGNANLATSGPAKVILNQVTGTGRSTLSGRLEVFGQAANVVIANPNGITCDGCGFINTPRVTLSTGAPEFGTDGALSGLSVAQGDVTIGTNGGDFSAQQVFDIVSRQIHVEGPVAGPSGPLRLIAGHNRFDYPTGTATVLADDGKDPGVAIDSAALGGMYAGRITLISNDRGAGVNMQGQMASNAGQMQLTADGHLVLRKADASGGTLQASSKSGTVELQDTAYSDTGLSLGAGNGISLDAGGLAAASGDVSLSGGTITLGAGAVVAAGVAADGSESSTGTLRLSATTISTGQGQLEGGAAVDLTATRIDLSRASDNGTNTVASLGDVDLAAPTIDASNGRVAADGALVLSAPGLLTLNHGRFAAAGALTMQGAAIANSATLAAGGTARLVAASGSIANSGTISGAGGLTATAATRLDNSGALLSQGALSLGAGANLSNASGATIAGGTGVALTAAAIANSGEITAQGGSLTLATPGDVTNSGTLFGAAGLGLAFDGALDNSGSLLSNGAFVLTGDSASRAGALTNAAGAQVNAASADLTAASLSNAGSFSLHAGDLSADLSGALDNSGTLSVNGTANLAVAGDVSNGGTLAAAGGLTLSTSGAVTNSGTLSAAGGLTIQGSGGGSAGTLTNTLAGVIDGAVGFELTAAALANAGQLGSGQGAVTVALGGNLDNSGLIYAGTSASFRLDGNATNNSGEILAETDLSLGGLSTAAAGAITNSSGTLEAVAGQLDLDATTMRNERATNPTITSTTTTTSSAQQYPFKDTGGATATLSSTTTTTTTTQSASGGSASGQILSGGDMVLSADTLTNAESQIAADGNLTLAAGSVSNQAITLTKTTVTTTKTTEYTSHYSGGLFNCNCVKMDSEWVVTAGPTTSVTAIGAVHGSITAGGTLTGTVSGYLANNSVTGGAAQSSLSAGGGAGLTAASAGSSAASAPTVTPANLSLDISSVLGKQAIFTTSPDPNAPYLVETRSAFIDPSKYLGSDYFLSQVDGDPNAVMKRFGDAYAESELVARQIFAKTGQRFIDGASDSVSQMKRLYDNALSDKQALGLSIGVALTPSQQAALTHDMVWMQSEIVDGQKVLVPVLYLASSSAANTSFAGATISGGEVQIAAGSVANSGAISARNGLDLSTSGTLDNSGGTLSAGADITLSADGELVNGSGRIVSGGDLAISAAALRNDTEILGTGGSDGSAEAAAQQATIRAGGDLAISTSDTLEASGGRFASGGAIALNAAAGVDLSALALMHDSTTQFAGGSSDSAGTTHLLTGLSAGTDLTLTSGGDMTLSGVQAQAGGNAVLQAAGDLSVASVQDRSSESVNARHVHITKAAVTTDASTIAAGGSLALSAGGGLDGSTGGQITLAGAGLTSGAAMSLAAGDVLLGATKDGAESYSQLESSGSLGFSRTTTTDQSQSTSYRRSTLTAGGKLSITATGTLESDGAQLAAGGDAALAADTIYAGALTGSASNSHQVKSSSFWGLAGSTHARTASSTSSQGTGLASASDLSLVSSGDTSLIAPEVTAGGKLAITTGGKLTLGEALNSRSVQGYDQSNNGLVIKTVTTERSDQSADAGNWSVGGTTTVQAAGGTTADLYTDLPTNAASQSGLTAASPGGDGTWQAGGRTLDPATILPSGLAAAVTDVNIGGLAHSYQHHESKQLSPAAMALIEAVAAVYAPELTGLSSSASAAGAAANAAVSTAAGDLAGGAVSGKLDPGHLLRDVAEAGLTAGVGQYASGALDQGLKLDKLSSADLLGFNGNDFSTQALARGAVSDVVSSGIETALDGGSFGKRLGQALKSTAVGAIEADAQYGIGDYALAHGGEANPVVNALHAAVGCAAGAATGGSCASGAVGAAAQSIAAGALDHGTLSRSDEARIARAAKTVGDVAATLASGGDAGNVAAAADVVSSAADNNYLSHAEAMDRAALQARLRKCQQGGACSAAEIAGLTQKIQALDTLDASRDSALKQACVAAPMGSACVSDAEDALEKLGIIAPSGFGLTTPDVGYRDLARQLAAIDAGDTPVDPNDPRLGAARATLAEYDQSLALLKHYPGSVQAALSRFGNQQGAKALAALATLGAGELIDAGVGGIRGRPGALPAGTGGATAVDKAAAGAEGAPNTAVPDGWRPVTGVGAQVNTPRGFTTYRTADGDLVHVSPGGLQYGADPKFGNRVDHVLDHTAPNPNKPVHSVFNVQGDDALNLVDEAWANRSGAGTLQANGNRTWTVDLGRPVGTTGQTSVQIVVRDGTNEIITAFPQ